MQAISKARHKHLVDALLQLEDLLKERLVNDSDLGQALIYREEIETMMSNYDRLVQELAIQIGDYLELYDRAKIKFLSVKLKELKKEIPKRSLVFPLLQQNIREAYGT